MTEPFTPDPHDPASEPTPGRDPSSQRTKTLLWVSAALAVVVVVIGVLIGTSGGDDPVGAASSSTPVTETVTVTPSPTTPETTDPPTTETTTTTDEPSASDSTEPSSTSDEQGGGSGRAVVYDCAGDPQVRPTDITSLYCGDNAVSLTGLQWSRWGPRSAVGVGTEVRKLCEPNCAQGSTVGSQVRVELGGLTRNGFTTAVVTDEDGGSTTYRLTGRSPR